MKKLISVIAVVILRLTVVAQETSADGWTLFARVKFNAKFFKELNEYFLMPEFDNNIKSLAGKEITVRGHYMPFDLPKNQLILSKNPYSSCFFCGGGGPESVVEAVLKSDKPKLKTDQVITLKGRLKLNDKDVNHLNFILENAEVITETKK